MVPPGGGICGAWKFIWFPVGTTSPYGYVNVLVPFTGTAPFEKPSVELQTGLLFTYQKTAMLPPPATVGVQTSEFPAETDGEDARVVGFTHVRELITAGARIVMVAVAVRVVCAWAIPVMVTMLSAPAG